MATRAVPAPLAYIPNALTIGRLVLIPVFVVLMVQAGDAPSWPAGIVWLGASIDHFSFAGSNNSAPSR